MKKCFGLISYLPTEINERLQRQKRLNNLVKQISNIWPDIDIIIIAQNWNDFSIECKYNNILRFNYPPLGILKARQTLREKFLELKYDYLIMFDDDAIIQATPKSAKAYMEELDKHPQGFCFIKGGHNKYNPYADSQLNLCAISRYIYLKEPMPNIDAQKSEGFEDRIFSTLLHYKYADKEFDAPKDIKCCHFKNPNIDKLGGEVPSTWARKASYNWTKMRDNTLLLEKYIVEHKDLPSDLNCAVNDVIDVVVPYVDSSDENWQALYTKYRLEVETEAINGKNRFRGQGDFFKYFFRCLEVNMPWINNVYLLVQNESQTPKWINKDKVKIITHEQFIPKKYLPTFNSCTIEMFLWNIPNLSEKFIYFNDDIFATRPLYKTDFFYEDKVLFNSHVSNLNTVYGNQAKKSYLTIFPKATTWEILSHTCRPYLKSLYKKCFDEYADKIDESISTFRSDKNFNCYLFSHYITKEDCKEISLLRTGYIAQTTTVNDVSDLTEYYTLCINDCEDSFNIYEDKKLNLLFNTYLPNKSKYEIGYDLNCNNVAIDDDRTKDIEKKVTVGKLFFELTNAEKTRMRNAKSKNMQIIPSSTQKTIKFSPLELYKMQKELEDDDN